MISLQTVVFWKRAYVEVLRYSATAQTMQRKPRCVVDESIGWPCRAAGRN